jgi:hypothetical protein
LRASTAVHCRARVADEELLRFMVTSITDGDHDPKSSWLTRCGLSDAYICRWSRQISRHPSLCLPEHFSYPSFHPPHCRLNPPQDRVHYRKWITRS